MFCQSNYPTELYFFILCEHFIIAEYLFFYNVRLSGISDVAVVSSIHKFLLSSTFIRFLPTFETFLGMPVFDSQPDLAYLLS